MDNNLPHYTDAIIYCQKNDLLQDDLGKIMLRILKAGVCDEHIGHMIKKRASRHQLRQSLQGKKVCFKATRLKTGNAVLGTSQYNITFYSQAQYLKGLCLSGSGAGKSTFSRFTVAHSRRKPKSHRTIMKIIGRP